MHSAPELVETGQMAARLVTGGVGGRLQVGRVLCGCGVLCCAGYPGGTLLAWTVQGIPPGGSLLVCLKR